MVNPKRDGTLESRPSDSAQGSQFRKVRGKMGHPRGILSKKLPLNPYQLRLSLRPQTD